MTAPTDEGRLLEAALRVLSTPKAGVALVLRLSLLPPPLPRPHHHRIARAILEEAAQRHHGELFEPACGDMVLLCRTPAYGAAAATAALQPTSLPHTLARLFRADAAGLALTTLWMLERDGTALLAYITRLAEAAPS